MRPGSRWEVGVPGLDLHRHRPLLLEDHLPRALLHQERGDDLGVLEAPGRGLWLLAQGGDYRWGQLV